MEKVQVYANNDAVWSGSPIALKCRTVTVTPEATMTQAPVETGVLINDCKVRRPTVIQMQVVLPVVGEWYDTIKKIRDLHQQFVATGQNAIKAEKNNLAVIQTRDGLYYNMVLLNCPHTEGVENFSTFEFSLRFQELLLAGTTASSSVADPSDKSLVVGGNK